MRKTYSVDGFQDGGSTCQAMWVASSGLWRTASKDTEISGPQLQGTESCPNRVHLEEDPNLHLRLEPGWHPGFSLVRFAAQLPIFLRYRIANDLSGCCFTFAKFVCLLCNNRKLIQGGHIIQNRKSIYIINCTLQSNLELYSVAVCHCILGYFNNLIIFNIENNEFLTVILCASAILPPTQAPLSV